jgi:hypothetical protein
MMGLEPTTFCMAKGTSHLTTPHGTPTNPHGYAEVAAGALDRAREGY